MTRETRGFSRVEAGFSSYNGEFSVHVAFTKIDHILGHKKTLNKFLKIEIMQSMFSTYNGVKLEINKLKIGEKPLDTWKLDNTLLSNLWVEEEVSKEKI